MKKAPEGGPASDPKDLGLRAYACKPGNFDQFEVGARVASIEPIDVHNVVPIK